MLIFQVCTEKASLIKIYAKFQTLLWYFSQLNQGHRNDEKKIDF